MRFKEAEEKSIGCELEKCPKKHLACCYNCPEQTSCRSEDMCQVFFLQTKQPFDLRERECKHLTSAEKLLWRDLFRRQTVL